MHTQKEEGGVDNVNDTDGVKSFKKYISPVKAVSNLKKKNSNICIF